MSGRAWAIKLGSGGRCVPFCEQHSIVGIGWKDVSSTAVASGSRDDLLASLHRVPDYKGFETKFGQWVGSLNRFGFECSEGDFVLYYDPSRKHVQIARVLSGTLYRDFDLDAVDADGDEADIWHYRRVEIACPPVPIVDFYGSLKGKLLGPRGTFWQLHEQFQLVEQIASGIAPGLQIARDAEIQDAKKKLEDLITARTEVLNASDWEFLAADYFLEQGAKIDKDKIGGNQIVIDFEAVFDHGDIPESVWRVQVKRYDKRPVDAKALEHFSDRAGAANLCFVSVFGFTEAARKFADETNMLLLQAESFTTFILRGNLRNSLKSKLLI